MASQSLDVSDCHPQARRAARPCRAPEGGLQLTSSVVDPARCMTRALPPRMCRGMVVRGASSLTTLPLDLHVGVRVGLSVGRAARSLGSGAGSLITHVCAGTLSTQAATGPAESGAGSGVCAVTLNTGCNWAGMGLGEIGQAGKQAGRQEELPTWRRPPGACPRGCTSDRLESTPQRCPPLPPARESPAANPRS
jgi:hypothetical protein